MLSVGISVYREKLTLPQFITFYMYRVRYADLTVYKIMAGTDQDQISIKACIHSLQDILMKLRKEQEKYRYSDFSTVQVNSRL